MQNTGLDKAQAGIKIARRNISNHKYADDTTLRAESKEELKSLLIKVKEKTNRWGDSDRLFFLGLQNHCRWRL